MQDRVGIVGCLLVDRWGHRTASDRYIALSAAVNSVVPGADLIEELRGLIEKVSDALREQVPSLPQPVRVQWAELASIFEEADSSERMSQALKD